jgi:hypothetical protein
MTNKKRSYGIKWLIILIVIVFILLLCIIIYNFNVAGLSINSL